MKPSSFEDGQQLGDDLAAGELDTALGVGDVKAEQKPCQLLVPAGVNAAQPRVDDHRFGVTL